MYQEKTIQGYREKIAIYKPSREAWEKTLTMYLIQY